VINFDLLNKEVCYTTKIVPFQVDAKALGDVEYVDAIMGSNEAFLRCLTPAAAEQLVSSAPWQQVEVLKGECLDHVRPFNAEYFLAYHVTSSSETYSRPFPNVSSNIYENKCEHLFMGCAKFASKLVFISSTCIWITSNAAPVSQ
jgi:hypothetical protein